MALDTNSSVTYRASNGILVSLSYVDRSYGSAWFFRQAGTEQGLNHGEFAGYTECEAREWVSRWADRHGRGFLRLTGQGGHEYLVGEATYLSVLASRAPYTPFTAPLVARAGQITPDPAPAHPLY